MNERLPFLRDKANHLPLEPGVYLMKNAEGTIIYVGKAKALKNRVTSYFRSNSQHNAKTIKLVEHIHDFDFIGILVLPVAEGRCDHDTLFLLLPIPLTNLPSDILCIIVIHQAADTDDQVIFITEGVYSFCGGDDAHLAFPQVVYE